MSKSRSVVLITVDCMRADHAGFMGYSGCTTPFLDGMAAESLVFTDAIVGGTPTYYSLPAILASRPPLALGRDVIGLAPGEPTLASAFRNAGYTTAAFCAGNPYISPRFGYDQGFDVFRDFLEAESCGTENCGNELGFLTRVNRKLEQLAKGGRASAAYNELYFQYCQRFATAKPSSLDSLRRFPAADVLVDQARAWIASVGSQPFFLWLHFMDPHSPYYPVESALGAAQPRRVTPFRARYLNSYWQRADLDQRRLERYRDEIVELYDAGIRWVDAQVKRLVDILRRFRRWDDCCVAFTADHGEEFLDHGGRYHQPRKLSEELIHVPLLIRVPGLDTGKRVGGPFTLLNLAPTILDGMEISVPSEFRGRSYWREILDRENWSEPAVVETADGCTNPADRARRLKRRILAVRDTRYKVVLRFDPPGEEWFDLAEDPAERKPLPEVPPDPVCRRLLEFAQRHLQDSTGRRDARLRISALLRDVSLDISQPTAVQRTAAVPF